MKDNTLFEKYTAIPGSDIGLYYCGQRIKTKNHVYGPEIRSHFLIVLIEDGKAVLHAARDIDMRTHDMLVMFPGERIYYEALTDWSIKWIGVFGNDLEKIFSEIGVTRQHPIVHPGNFSDLQKIISDIYEIGDKTELAAHYKCQALLNDFFASLFRGFENGSEIDPVSYAAQLIDCNYNTSLDIDSIAGAVNMNSAYFSRLFKQKCGFSPKQYVTHKRMEKARELLANDGLSIKEIALSVGYSYQLYFCRCFKKAVGISPTEYRESIN